MERLTENVGNGVRLKGCGNSICMAVCNSKRDCFACPIDEAFRKLAAYEDAEEQGLLVRLPCKVGDTLFCIIEGTIRELRVHHFDMPAFGTADIVFRYADGFKLERFIGELGKTTFLTREEAEKKLEEMKK